MAKILITAQVNDLAAWEESFRTHADMFSEQGMDGTIFYGMDDSNLVAVMIETDDPEGLIASLSSPETLDAMNADGVIADSVRIVPLDGELEVDAFDDADEDETVEEPA